GRSCACKAGASARLPTYDLTCEGRARAAPALPGISGPSGPAARPGCTLVVLSRAATRRRCSGGVARAVPQPMILTTHTGSLPRPTDLSEMMLQYDAGQLRDVDV